MEHARQTTQQMQSLWETLQKEIADVISAKLTPVYAKLTALQTYDIKLDALVVQMVQAEACKSELEKKGLEIEEKEDNHIAHLEAQLEDL